MGFFHIFHIISLFNFPFFCMSHIFSFFNLLRTLPVTLVLILLYYILYYYYSKNKMRGKAGHAQTYFRSFPVRPSFGHVTSGDVTSGITTSNHLHKYGFVRTHILLWRKPGYPVKKTIDLSQVTDKLYHIMLYRVHLAIKHLLLNHFPDRDVNVLPSFRTSIINE